MAFSPDGSLLAAASREGSTRLADVAAGQWLAIVASRNVGAERLDSYLTAGASRLGMQTASSTLS